jgi:exodeoxyribonuclease-5
MLTVSSKILQKLDEQFGRRWITQNMIEALGGSWPLAAGWRIDLFGNSVNTTEKKLEALATKEAGKNNDVKTKSPTVLKEVTGPVILSEEQMAVVDPLIKLHKPVQSLGGLAGSGKTTVVSHLMKRLNGFACCAFTGKAAEVLRSKGVDASTIHSLIYTPTDEKDQYGTPKFVRKHSLGIKGIVVDEASMVGASLYSDLISYGLPIIFVGDHGQLEPVGEDLYLMKNPDYKLETIHRNAGDIALFAHHLRSGAAAADFKESPLIKVIKKADSYSLLPDADQVICALNTTRVSINRYIRKLKGNEGDQPVMGDRVISLMNSRRLGIYNGSQGVVRSVSLHRMSVAFDNGKLVKTKYDVGTFNQEKPVKDGFIHPIDYAYAVTCHKAQGSEWDKVMVIEQICSLWEHKRWAYTAASRAKKELIWVLPE